ncbi:hypothetical protein ACE1CD_15555 [Aerosakkonema sp. BLCC-F183]|uniref:hypothetical protein n=1 Tax=Aerosakkonema sp. BLCC-F183 TaxID=3342834 RepID=UPI0035B73652
MDIQKELTNSVQALTNWLANYEKVYVFQSSLNDSIQKLDNWLARWKQIYAIVRKKSYSLLEAQQLAAIFSCSVIRVGTTSQYYLMNKDNKILFIGDLVGVVDYCFNRLIEI